MYKRQARDIEFLRKVLKLQEWDAIVDFMVYSTEEFSCRVQLLLNATRQYLFLSSSRVYADTNGALIKEDSPRLLDTINDSEYLQTDEYAPVSYTHLDVYKRQPLSFPFYILETQTNIRNGRNCFQKLISL